jgi:hypothetical protein
MERKCEFNLVVGINGTGKTTWLNKNAVEPFQKSLIVTAHDCEWNQLPEIKTAREIYDLKGRARMVYEDMETLTNLLQYHGGSLIFDDGRMFLNAKTAAALRKIYIKRRQRGIDIFLSAHGLRQIPVEAFSFASWLFLFNTTENFADRKKDIYPDLYNKIVAAQAEVYKKVQAGDPYFYKTILIDEQIRALWKQNKEKK